MSTPVQITRIVLPFIAVSCVLFGVRWKQEHPTITPLDAGVRKRFQLGKDTEISIAINNAQHIHPLSPQEREEIASHLWLTSQYPADKFNDHNVTIKWEHQSRREFINLGDTTENDFYLDANSIYYDVAKKYPKAVTYHLHPITSRYLRQWLSTRPNFERKIKQTPR